MAGAGFLRLVFERPPKPANDDAAGAIVGGAFHLVVDVENELRHIVVPIERNNSLGSKPAAVAHIERGRRGCREIIGVIKNGAEDFCFGDDPLGDPPEQSGDRRVFAVN